MPCRYALLSMLLTVACTGNRVELRVDLRTDLVPGQEFVRVVSELTAAGAASPYMEAVSVEGDFPAFDGSRIAEFANLQEGPYRLLVWLEDEDGAVLAERPVDLALRESFAVTVLITRNCRGVQCDDPERAACLGGLCVPAECTPETDERCGPPACRESIDCAASNASCAEAECAAGACLYRGTAGACAATHYCNPDSGCHVGPPGTLVSAESILGASGEERALDISALPGGGAAVVGRFAGATPSSANSAGMNDGFVAVFPADGTVQEVRTLGGTEDDMAGAVAVDDAGNVFVGGSFRGSVDFGGGTLDSADRDDVFLASYSPLGFHRWSSRHGGSDEENVGDLVVCADQLYLVGGFRGDWDPGPGGLTSAGGADAFVAKFSLDGTLAWSQRVGGTGEDSAASVACDGAGGVLVTGTFSGTVDLGGVSASASGGSDVFIMKFASDGLPSLFGHFGGGADDSGNAIARDPSGNVYIGGSFVQSIDFGGASHGPARGLKGYVVSFSPSGDYRWSQALGSSDSDFVEGLVLDGDGNVVVTGGFSGPMDLGSGLLPHADRTDIFVASYDSDGVHRWSRAFGNTGVDVGWALSVDRSDPMIQVAGSFAGTVDFPTGPRTASGGADGILLRLVP